MTYSLHRMVLATLVLAGLISGCRTYGGYGTEQATYEQIQQVAERFASDLERARADLNLLRRAANTRPALEPMAEAFAHAVEAHAETLAEHRTLAEEATTSKLIMGEYRELNRTLGAMVQDQRLIDGRYLAVMRRVAQEVGATRYVDLQIPPKARYQIATQYYEQIRYNAARPTMREVLRGVTLPSEPAG